MSRAISIFLCDDVPELRALLRYGLEEDPGLLVVGEAGNAEAAIAGVRDLRPDVLVLDLSMPGMDGLEALPLLREAAPGTAVIVFSGFASDRMSEPALALGAARYLEKGEPIDALRGVVRDVVENAA